MSDSPYGGADPFTLDQGSQLNRILTQILSRLIAGINVLPTPAVYTVANLPTTAASGQFAFASNGRKGGEGAGLGTGVPVYWNSATSQWFTYYGNALVTS